MSHKFDITFPVHGAATPNAPLLAGDALFVLGANGTGKSSLMLHFAKQNYTVSRRLSAHRQTWMNTDALTMTPASKINLERNIRNQDREDVSRYRDDYAAERASMTIYELIDAENVRAREITAHVDASNMNAAAEAARQEAPITVINELLRQSNIPITVSIRKNERLMASKNGGPEYSVAKLSDGERNALLIAGNVLTAPPNCLLIIDEPERHLHRSIISPLLSQLFACRSDCAFVVSTHDHDLPLSMPGSRVILLRSCTFAGSRVTSWEADEVPVGTPIDDSLKSDLLGARRNILFVEGTDSSLDKPMYSRVFPMASVIARGSCRQVERAVSALQADASLHWVRAFGIVDGDGRTPEDGHAKNTTAVYSLPYYAVEAIYYHPQIIARIAQRQARIMGDDASQLANQALSAAVKSIAGETERLSRKVAKKLARRKIIEQIPGGDILLTGHPLTIANDGDMILATRMQELDDAVKSEDWELLLTKSPVRESGALHTISVALRFRHRRDYEKAVRHLLDEDENAMRFVRELFGDLFERLTETC